MEEIQQQLEAEQREAMRKTQERLEAAKAWNERHQVEKKKKEDEEKERIRKQKEREEAKAAEAAEEEQKKVSQERALKVSISFLRVCSEADHPSGVQEEQGCTESAAGGPRWGKCRNGFGFLGRKLTCSFLVIQSW